MAQWPPPGREEHLPEFTNAYNDNSNNISNHKKLELIDLSSMRVSKRISPPSEPRGGSRAWRQWPAPC